MIPFISPYSKKSAVRIFVPSLFAPVPIVFVGLWLLFTIFSFIYK